MRHPGQVSEKTRYENLSPDETVDLYLEEFRSLQQGEFSREPSPVSRLRQAGMDRFTELGFPTPALEDWKHTDITAVARKPFRRVGAENGRLTWGRLEPYLMGDFHRAVVVNGRFDRTLSSPPSKGIEITSLADTLNREPERVSPLIGNIADHHNHAFVALNTAFMTDGVFIHVPENTVVDRPIHIVVVSDPAEPDRVFHLRHLIWVEPGSEVTVVEHYLGLSGENYWINHVTETVVGENAKLRHVKLQEDSVKSHHIAATDTRQLGNSSLLAWSISVGGKLTRNDIKTRLDGEGCECLMNGLVLARGQQHVDNHTFVIHEMPHSTSHQLFKGIHGERSHGVFNGRIYVQKGALKTNADQENRNLLLSREALVNSNPQLEINADDVRCTHGSTTGRLDEEAIFYLRSRGLDLVSARTLMATAFATEVVQDIPSEPIRDYVTRLVSDWLSGVSWEVPQS